MYHIDGKCPTLLTTSEWIAIPIGDDEMIKGAAWRGRYIESNNQSVKHEGGDISGVGNKK